MPNKNFRFYVKKRGSRRTDSRLLGNVAQTVFFTVLFLGGLVFGGRLLVYLVIPEWRANHQFLPADCVVISKDLVELETPGDERLFRPEVQIVYEIRGKSYHARTYDMARAFSADRAAQQAVIDQFVVGRKYPCWYDPRDPASVVLVRGYTWSSWLLMLVPLALFVGGFSGLAITLLNWGKSAERRAALMRQAIPLEFFGNQNGTPRDHPTIPQRAALTDSPGTELRYRLAADRRATWLFAALFGASLLVLAGAGVFGALTARSFVSGKPDVLMSAFAAVWILVGAGGAVDSARRLIKAAAVAPTILEISDHPLYPGQTYQLYFSQRGRARLGRVKISLVCEERVTSQQGTNTRRETRRVVEVPIANNDVDSSSRRPYEGRFTLRVPARSMHSFRADHNAIEWKLCIDGKFQSGATLERSFPVILYPPR